MNAEPPVGETTTTRFTLVKTSRRLAEEEGWPPGHGIAGFPADAHSQVFLLLQHLETKTVTKVLPSSDTDPPGPTRDGSDEVAETTQELARRRGNTACGCF